MRSHVPGLLIPLALAGCALFPTYPDPDYTVKGPKRPPADSVYYGFAPLELGATWEYRVENLYSNPVQADSSHPTGEFFHWDSLTVRIDSAWESGDTALYRIRFTSANGGWAAIRDTNIVCRKIGDSLVLPGTYVGPFPDLPGTLALELPFSRSDKALGKNLTIGTYDGEGHYFLSEGRSTSSYSGIATMVDGIGMVSGEFRYSFPMVILGSSRYSLRLFAHNGRPVHP